MSQFRDKVLKSAVGISLALTAVFYVIGLTGNCYLFIFLFPFLFWGFILSILTIGVILLIRAIRKFSFKAFLIVCCAIVLAGAAITYHARFTRPREPSTLEKLRALSYVTWVPAKNVRSDRTGVAKIDAKRVSNGLNAYISLNRPAVYLIDMSGNLLHEWTDSANPADSRSSKAPWWYNLKICKNGDVLVIVHEKKLIRIDWDCRVKWEKKMRFHHDIDIAENGDVYTLTRESEIVFAFGLPLPILNDYIVILSPDGLVKKKISLFRVLKKNIPFKSVLGLYNWIGDYRVCRDLLRRKSMNKPIFRERTAADILHNNTVTIAHKDIPGLCAKGDVLISSRELDFIGVVDMKKERLAWSWGPGNLNKQHHPTLLENGNILIFDNGFGEGYSRVIELDPSAGDIVWEYTGVPRESFYSSIRGSAQRLPNGNTLITESNKGHVFEVTKDGETVWDFRNPEINKKKGKRAAIFRMTRITDPATLDTFKRLMK